MHSLVSDELEEELNKVQMDIANKDIPVLVIFEGGSGRVISRVVNELDRVLEPRGINYYHFDVEKNGPKAMARLLQCTPAKGEISMYDRSWYATAINRFEGDREDLDAALDVLNRFEEYLLDNGTFIIKVRLAVTPEIMKEYADEYRPYTAMNGTFLSVDRIDHFKYYSLMDDVVAKTDTKRAPWDTVRVGHVEKTVNDAVKVLLKRFKQCIKDDSWKESVKCGIDKVYENPREGLELDRTTDGFKKEMGALSEELERLQILLAVSGRSVILGFEGWDAAGKGGCIKHISHALNPRGYRVARVGKPTEEDYAHTYLWRFCRSLPGPGHISIFDRTWYGRMMVEPIEGFCTKEEYQRSAAEINTFESMLSDSGAIIIKFWLDIDKDTQLQRFNDRKADPLKQWKLTDEDWRNREKWDIYEEYIDAMISSTNTPYAPWVVVPANNKKYAQLTVMRTLVGVLRRELES
ncbi:hypothetical protein [Methanomethylophilus alvi]|uniref:hypothetical protein n=1 Tax=Methanomethylophilus alvi TaxID=1291540 RepID=UPI0037DD2BD2